MAKQKINSLIQLKYVSNSIFFCYIYLKNDQYSICWKRVDHLK